MHLIRQLIRHGCFVTGSVHGRRWWDLQSASWVWWRQWYWTELAA